MKKADRELEKQAKNLEKVLRYLGMYDNVPQDIIEEHLKDTPKRIIKAWGEFTCDECELDIRTFKNPGFNEIILVKEIPFNSLCLHHFFPFTGLAACAYIADKKIIGLSKIPKIVKNFAKRPQYQEKLVHDIANYIERIVEPKGCMVIMEARHQCTACRGVESESKLVTSAIRGCFLEEPELEMKVLQMIGTLK